MISCCLFIESYEYLMMGYMSGEVKAWKVIAGKKDMKMLTFTFIAHCRPVESIVRH